MKTKNLFIVALMIIFANYLTSCKKKDDAYVGQQYGGGIIFYVDATKHHGLIAATNDQHIELWGPDSIRTKAYGTGQANTTQIIAAQGDGNSAASLCNKSNINGYNDWFLPSRIELNRLFVHKDEVGSFSDNYYWSSTEKNDSTAWAQKFGCCDDRITVLKSKYNLVRAIRAF